LKWHPRTCPWDSEKDVLSNFNNPLAYTKGEAWLNQVNQYIDRNLEFVGDFVSKHFPKARYSIPEGTYFAWIDFNECGHSPQALEKMASVF